MISIVIPFYKMKNHEFYLNRCLDSIRSQTYQDYEIIIADYGKASHNVNMGVKDAKGEYIKILCMDDYFTHKDSLKEIAKNIKTWLINGVSNHKEPYYTGDVHKGNNRLGGLSSIACKKDLFMGMDEEMVWLFDCDWHKKMYLKYGNPQILNGDYVTIEEGDTQATNNISDEIKRKEFIIINKRYV